MHKAVKYIILSLTGIILAGCITVSYILGERTRRDFRCEGVNIVIADSTENLFVSGNDIKEYLKRQSVEYIGLPIDSIDLAQVERIIDSRSAVHKSQAYTTKDGMLNITVTQRHPIARFQNQNGGFYADEEGYVFPLQSSFSAHVHVIEGELPVKTNSGHKGEIEDKEGKEWLDKVLNVVRYMENDRKWKDRIVQISVENGGELILIPRKGQERFIFGQPTQIKEKFEKIEMYYTHIIPEKGSTYYKEVDLKYDGQIVCRQ